MVGDTDGQRYDQLWVILERTRPVSIDPVAHAEALFADLVGADTDTDTAVVVAQQFHSASGALHTWDLWAAAQVLLGGCSDDRFERLRAWIIGRGSEAFERALHDPDGYLAHLLDGTARDLALVAQRLADLAELDGGPLLAAVGESHRRLTGAWSPPVEPGGAAVTAPIGTPWAEGDAAVRAPKVAAARPAAPTIDDGAGDAVLDTARQIRDGLEAHGAGDHRYARDLLGSVVDDPARWVLVADVGADPVEVAYVAGTTRLAGGDPDGAAAVFRLVDTGDRPAEPRIRRSLAQVDLARGHVDAAAQLLDESAGAELMDQALVATVRWRQGRRDDAARLAEALVRAEPGPQQHGQPPLTVAEALVPAGFVLAELGDLPTLLLAVERIFGLIGDAPMELPLRWESCLLLASARRQEGNLEEAGQVLEQAEPFLDPDTCAMGLLELEQARIALARADRSGASRRYQRAVATFDAAGERWHADQVRAEAERG